MKLEKDAVLLDIIWRTRTGLVSEMHYPIDIILD